MDIEHVNKMIGKTADQIIKAIAIHHDFTLPVTTLPEIHRLLGFVEACEEPINYPELADLEPKLFYSARCELRIRLNNIGS